MSILRWLFGYEHRRQPFSFDQIERMSRAEMKCVLDSHPTPFEVACIVQRLNEMADEQDRRTA